MTPSIDQTLHLFANLFPNWTLIPMLTLLPNFGGFHRTLQRVRLANRGRLLLRTLVLSHLGLAFVLMLRPFFPELVMSTDLLSFEHLSVLLFYSKKPLTSIPVFIFLNRKPLPNLSTTRNTHFCQDLYILSFFGSDVRSPYPTNIDTSHLICFVLPHPSCFRLLL